MPHQLPACIIQTTVANAKQADVLIQALLAQQLAACIQQNPIRSHYLWQGQVCCDEEIRLSIKTISRHYAEIEALISQHHPYDCPQIIMWQITGLSNDYQRWLSAACGEH